MNKFMTYTPLGRSAKSMPVRAGSDSQAYMQGRIEEMAQKQISMEKQQMRIEKTL